MKQWNHLEWKKKVLSETGADLLYLVSCAIHERAPNQTICQGMDSGKLLIAAELHGISAMISYSLEMTGYAGMPEDIAEKFKIRKNKAIRKNILLSTERMALFSFMEEEGIRHLPLKGIVLQELYPVFGIREMADNDIFYDEVYQKKIRNYMLKRGFRTEKARSEVHDCYYREPVYNFELHRKLFPDDHYKEAVSCYYNNVWDIAQADRAGGYGYHLSKEDFYVYVTAHADKHYRGAGAGIRTLTDFFVMKREFADADWEYIHNELNIMNLQDFEQKMSRLAVTLLSDPDIVYEMIRKLPEHDRKMLYYILTSGAYGSKEYWVINRYHRLQKGETDLTPKARCRYYLKRLFPSRTVLKSTYPLAKYQALLPVVYMLRLLKAVAIRKNMILNEVMVLERYGKQSSTDKMNGRRSI